jgi:hypothetical protein
MPNNTAIWMKDVGGTDRQVLSINTGTAPGTTYLGFGTSNVVVPALQTTGLALVGGLTVSADKGGIAGDTTFTNATVSNASCLASATGCIRIYIGTTARYIPYY